MSDMVEGFGLAANTAVYVCQRVFDGAPILHVSHDEDGDWQFLCGGIHSEGGCPGKVGSLHHIISLNPGLRELADLCEGWTATRESVHAPWVRRDESEEVVRENVRKYGWHVSLIEEDDEGPGFAYSIGLYETFKKPEVIIFGLPTDVMHRIINDIGEEHRSGRPVVADGPQEGILKNLPVHLKPVLKKHYKEYFGYGLWYYSGPSFPAVQCFWPDRTGKFPWEGGFPEDWLRRQPDLS